MQILVSDKTPKIDRLAKNLEKTMDLQSVGNVGVSDIQRNVDTQGANIGQSWPALKWRSGQRLKDHNDMYRSVHFEQTGNSVYIIASKTTDNPKSGRRVNIPYIQHTGIKIKVTEKMRRYLAVAKGIFLKSDTTHIVIPPTKFMTVSKMAENEIVELILEKLVS